MKQYKKGYIEQVGNDIEAVITKITITEEYELEEIEEEEVKRFGGFESKEEAAEFLKAYKVKEIEEDKNNGEIQNR